MEIADNIEICQSLGGKSGCQGKYRRGTRLAAFLSLQSLRCGLLVTDLPQRLI